MKTSPLVLVTEGSDSAPLAWLKERARVIEAAPDTPDFNATLSEVEGMVVRPYPPLNEGIPATFPRFERVCRGRVGGAPPTGLGAGSGLWGPSQAWIRGGQALGRDRIGMGRDRPIGQISRRRLAVLFLGKRNAHDGSGLCVGGADTLWQSQ